MWFNGKESTSSAAVSGDAGSIPESERFTGRGIYTTILAWRILQTEELGGLQSIGRKESDTTQATSRACSDMKALEKDHIKHYTNVKQYL